jgi:hypothetical protein
VPIQIVPVVQHRSASLRRRGDVEAAQWHAGLDQAQQMEAAMEQADIAVRGDQRHRRAAEHQLANQIAFVAELRERQVQRRDRGRLGGGRDQQRAGGGGIGMGERAAGHPRERAIEFGGRGGEGRRPSRNHQAVQHGANLRLPRRRERMVAQPQLIAVLGERCRTGA